MASGEMGRMPFFYNQEGRLVQVDYALQAVSRGSTTLDLKTKDFAVLSSQVKPTRPLMEPAEKVFVVDEHIGATGSGYIGDVTTLLDQLRVAAQRHRLVYDEPIDVGTLSRNLSEYLHEFTMYAVRPFGASVVIAGVDALGVQLIQVDPSGTTFKGSAFAIGQSADEALDTIVKGYRPDLNVEQAIALSTQAIEAVNGVSELMMRQPPFAEDLENRLLHRLVLRLADVDPPLFSLRCNVRIFSSTQRREKMRAI